MEFISQPWPWYVAGPLIGLMVPLLLWIGNKQLGISSSLRHICAACIPANIPFFTYDWKQQSWNLWFMVGIILGGVLGGTVFIDTQDLVLNPNTVLDLQLLGISSFKGMAPEELISWQALTSWKGILFQIVGGFMVGFGTRYAGGCTSGHTIMGLSNLQWVSLVATIGFFIGGLLMTWIGLPLILGIN